MRVGLIGYGAVGREVARRIMVDEVPGVELARILVRHPPSESGFVETVSDPTLFFRDDLDLVIEAAGHDALKQNALEIVERGISLVVVSVGALVDSGFAEKLRSVAGQRGAKIYFPSCAIAGLDRVAAAREGELRSVRLITRKPVRAWFGTFAEDYYDLANLTDKVLLYSGHAREAAARFPESVNVSAALGLAGLGMDKTRVEVWIDPSISSNVHEVNVEGDFGHMHLEVSNHPSSNPKTGVIVAMSIIKLLRNLTGPFVIGL